MMSLEDQGYVTVTIPYDNWTIKLERWLAENGNGHHEIDYGQAVQTMSSGRIALCPYTVWFEDADDAMLFKLTWGGDS